MYETKNCPIFRFTKQTFFRGYKSRMSKYVTGPVTSINGSKLNEVQMGFIHYFASG